LVKAHALALHYHSGLPLRKVPGVIEQLTGVSLGQSALTQSATGLCAEGGLIHGIYDELREEVNQSPVVNTDDTGWRINGVQAYVMAFITATVAYFQIRPRHRHQEVREVLKPGVKRMIGTDRGPSYKAKEMSEEEFQKCLSHLLTNVSKVEATKKGAGKWFGTKLKELLREGLTLHGRYKSGELSLAAYHEAGEELDGRLGHHLRSRTLKDADHQRLLDGIGEEWAKGHVTLFLREPEIEPTNNVAERGLRPAVIARKVSHCSKNERGAATYAQMKTIFATLAKRGANVVGAFARILKGQSLQAAAQG
jgi:hypothetical protein